MHQAGTGHHWGPDVGECRRQPAGERQRCYFELMSVATFKSGLNYAVVEAKWAALREAFHGFDPRKVAAMTGKEIERIEGDPKLIRSRLKIQGVVDNAHAMLDIEREHAGFAEWLDSLPDTETRIRELHRRFKFMGPTTAYWFLHYAGENVPGWHEWGEEHPEIFGRTQHSAHHR